jgi:hypothetical protein
MPKDKPKIQLAPQEDRTMFGFLPRSVETAVPALALTRGTQPFEDAINTLTSQIDDLYAEQKKQITESDRGKFWSTLEAAFPILELTKVGEGGKVTQIDKTAAEAAGEVGIMLLLPKIIEKVGNRFRGIERLANRRKVLAEASNAKINGDQLLDDLMNQLDNVSPTDKKAIEKYMLQAIDQYGGKTMSMESAVDLYSQANKAFSSSGKVGKSAKAAFNLALRDSLKSQMPKEIIQATTDIAKAYGLKKFINKVFNPLTIAGTATGVMISSGIRNAMYGNQ